MVPNVKSAALINLSVRAWKVRVQHGIRPPVFGKEKRSAKRSTLLALAAGETVASGGKRWPRLLPDTRMGAWPDPMALNMRHQG